MLKSSIYKAPREPLPIETIQQGSKLQKNQNKTPSPIRANSEVILE